MNNDLTYDQILDRLLAYVMGALEPDEMLAVDAYISQQQALLARLQESEEAAAQMAHLAPAAPLPGAAKERLLQRVQTDLAARQAGATTADVIKPRPVAKPPTDAAGFGHRLSGFWASFRRLNGWTVATAGAMAALIVVLLYTGQVRDRLSQVETRRDALQAELAQVQATIDELQQTNQILQLQLQTEQERLAFMASVPPGRIVPLPGTDEAPSARGLFYLGDNNQALLALSGLPPLTSQQTYQLWLIPADQAPIPAGLLAVEPEPTTLLTVQLPPGVQEFAKVGISVEPAGGSSAPTGPIVLLGETTR
jgi:anti-sigma-K factor RskA